MLLCPSCSTEERPAAVFSVRCSCGGLYTWSETAAPPSRGWVTPLWREPHSAVLWKREDLNPTGSFKDRGAEELGRVVERSQARRLVVDSSGSAALASARAAAKANCSIRIHTPEVLSSRRKRTLRQLGADVVAEGDREDAARRAQEDSRGAFWFTHVYHPAFSHGVSGMVEELADQVEALPSTWFVPVGNGSLLLGLARGLERLGRAVTLVAVQAAACPGLTGGPPTPSGSRAGGIAIVDPPRKEAILNVLEGRDPILVAEEEILESEGRLAAMGVLADPAAAAVHAAIRKVNPRGPVLAILSGSGSR